MAGAPIPINEAQRQLQVTQLCRLDTTPDEVFEHIVSMVAAYFQAPIALISIVDEQRQWFTARVGLLAQETPRQDSFCAYAILANEPFQVLDATRDARFQDNPLVTGEPGIRFYAGMPLVTPEGLGLGSLCIIDTQPRRAMTPQELSMLEHFAKLTMARILTLRRTNFIDASTGLLNRSRLEDDVARAASTSQSNVLVVADVIGPMLLNDIIKVLGHSFAQALMLRMKQTLQAQLPEPCGLYCISPSRFAFLIPDGPSGELTQLYDRIIAAFDAPVQCNSIPIKTQIGLGVLPLHSGVLEQDWLRLAITSADDARDRGIGWSPYESRLDAVQQRAFTLLSGLAEALHGDGQLRLVYQPRISLDDGRCTSVEALLRWDHPTLGAIGPAEFIPLAEKTALIRELSLWVAEQAVLQAAAWQRQGARFKVAINVSASDLDSPAFANRFIELLNSQHIDPTSLEVEFTESALMRNPGEVSHQLQRLRSLGVEVAIDDFGTGYSNWTYLRDLPASTVKLDQSFIRHLGDDEKDRRLVRTIIDLAKRLELRVVAEGIETQAICELVAQWGCDEGQGYYIARPMAPELLLGWTAQNALTAQGSAG
ncbi:MAG: sensor domain-containing phosphodiesterase [Gammaproteobacteria bacterium]|uniref:sensor domain-containing phosphodiesterase n=1 Tax=Stutzerimonas xanthomarina TaxID=271420 RepID=UPI00190BC2F6|nr:sensor domain-containing phosphodiesterase [Stutzerimonas xanthomarina]MBU0810610.1 sensor domain-containing phosphodiesterase [Gammaproteobacteria bacterium]MBK3849663.1 EAL domain-containing protein [Stutzerimonas xanthomarina]MBU0853293.1 sensor domain-containing phosphodiesterase [Gammaproteobacteria bacterium]MBU1300370.1 sensor domain-containing phosphodiesterase [Gammaproteobacteria bacterium]MBU1458433.1 sensor domain-containing phosphodiesterase [Gammaproteobacteria bacterium]|tara:strand:+ start:16230 stop:18020 length:1791 start_codon:yes stop_codon:yes gene_type:complete